MTRGVRLGMFYLGALGLAALFAWGFAGLPDFGHYAGPYGDILVKVTKPQRHIANVVAAIVFDYRGLDTLGEELILVAAATGTALLLRETSERDVRDVVDATEADAVHVVGAAAAPVTLVIALSVIAHGYLTPGGGFQGGVLVSAAVVLVFLSCDYGSFHGIARISIWDAVEGFGAGAYAGLGLLALALGWEFLQNFLPLGTFGRLTSGGLVPLLNWSAGVAVTGGFVLIFGEYLEEAMALRHGKVRR